MAKVTGSQLGDALCEAIGVNPQTVYRVILDCKVHDVARVITHGFAETDDGKIDRLKREIKKYRLEED